MNTVLSYLAMGKYGLYVWPAYGVFFIVILLQVMGFVRQRKQQRKLLKQWYKGQD